MIVFMNCLRMFFVLFYCSVITETRSIQLLIRFSHRSQANVNLSENRVQNNKFSLRCIRT